MLPGNDGMVPLLGALGGLFSLASADQPGPESVAAWGPWAIAFILLLIYGAPILMKAVGKSETPKQGTSADDALRGLASALEKLTMVLERMEKSQEKGQEEIRAELRELAKAFQELKETLQRLDYRTYEIRERVVGGASGGAEVQR